MNKIHLVSILILACCITFLEINKRKEKLKRNQAADLEMFHKMQKIEELREKFKYDLVGRWVSCQGTFDSIMNEEMIFNEDGTGLYISRSLSSGEDKSKFCWRKKGVRCIEIKFDEGNWMEIPYDFKIIATDCGYFPTLVELDHDKNPKKGFGIFEIPFRI